MMRLSAASLAALLALSTACVPPVRSTASGPVTRLQLAEFWEEPRDLASRDLYWGPWGQRFAPKPGQTYTFVEEKVVGFSPGFTVKDGDGIEWSVKQGPEAGVEVTVSRILSALGYHQPPVYFVKEWIKDGGPGEARQGAGRFRPKGASTGLDDAGSWSWQQNPFVGTPQYGGLIALMMLLNETDLKTSNNTLYTVDPAVRGSEVRRWYVVRDIGAALGETGKLDPRRGDPFVFEKLDYLRGMKDGFVRFNYRGRHQELVERIPPGHVKWMVNLASRLTPAQWEDAFRAGGYGPETSKWFIRKIMAKLDEGRQLP